MRIYASFFRIARVGFGFMLLLALTGCPKPQQVSKPKLTGANEKLTTSGKADDADDQNGRAKTYTTPAKTATDGPTRAQSDPQNFKSLRGNVTAQIGPQPIRLASADAKNKATSTFVVTKAATCKLEISSTGSATLNSGIGGYEVSARILNAANGQFVIGSGFKNRYDFKENANNKLDVSENGQKFTEIANGGFISPIDTGGGFTLQPGTYTLEFELNIDAKADSNAIIKVSASVALN